MIRSLSSPLAWAALLLAAAPALAAAQQAATAAPEARIRIDRGEEPVVQRGERVAVELQVSPSAYVAVFQIDTDGSARLVHPRDPLDDSFVRGGRQHRLLVDGAPFWIVDDAPGVGYFFVVASPEPLDFSRFRHPGSSRGWDLSRIGRRVYRDPYVAMDDYVAALIPDWERVAYALDFTEYHVDERRPYPRFLCYDCHGFQPYRTWNPYHTHCTSFRVVVFSDPYYYPAHRYRPDRVVFTRPPVRGQPRFAFKERVRDESPAPLVVSHTPGRDRPSIPGLLPPVRRGEGAPDGAALPADRSGIGIPVGEGGTVGRGSAPASRALPGRPGAVPRRGEANESAPETPTGRRTAPGRPSSVLPGRRPEGEPRSRAERPRLERRKPPSAEPPGGNGGRPDPRARPAPERPSPPSGRSAPPRTPPSRTGPERPAPPSSRARPQRRPSSPSSRARPEARPSAPPRARPERRRPPPQRSQPERRPPPRRSPPS